MSHQIPLSLIHFDNYSSGSVEIIPLQIVVTRMYCMCDVHCTSY